jgi:two-component system chemotaxis response regulator CheY
MMPEMDGQQALKQIRALEEAKGILSTDGAKIIMTTALGDMKNVMTAFSGLADDYMVKPIDKAKLLDQVRKFKLIS